MRKKHIHRFLFTMCKCIHTFSLTQISDIHAETSSDISSLIQPLIGFGHRVEGVMKDSSNKRQTGGREKERWGSKTRGGRREESLFGRNL